MRRKTTAAAEGQVDFERLELDARRDSGLLAWSVRMEMDYRAFVVAPNFESARRAAFAYTSARAAELVGFTNPHYLLADLQLRTATEDIREGEAYFPLVISSDAPPHEDWPEYLKKFHAEAMTPIDVPEHSRARLGGNRPARTEPVQWREPSYTDRERAILAACDGLGDPVGVLNLARELAANTAILGDMIAAPGWKEDDAEYEGRIARQTDLACAIMVAVEGGKTPDVAGERLCPKCGAGMYDDVDDGGNGFRFCSECDHTEPEVKKN